MELREEIRIIKERLDKLELMLMKLASKLASSFHLNIVTIPISHLRHWDHGEIRL